VRQKLHGRARSEAASFDHAYQIVPDTKLGHGIAGTVHQCIHLPTSQVNAVKIIDKSKIKRQDRLRREIAFLKQVSHPSIIRMYDHFEDENKVHIVTEMCRGGELFDKIVENAKKRHPEKSSRGADGIDYNRQVPACFAEADAARIIKSLLSAVSFLHSRDIVHRDLKPENILFVDEDTDDSPIKLIDFGLSIRHTRECPPLSNVVGTSYYMAPELLRGCYDRSCDLWSIGVISYIMLSGRPPFNGSDDESIFKKIRKGQYKMEGSIWDGISECAKDFIRCLLEVDPSKRWTAQMASEHAWLKLARLYEDGSFLAQQ